MKRSALAVIIVCTALCASLFATITFAQSDLEPPTLAALTISPEYVNTSVGDQAITVTVRVTDNLSGVDGMSIYFSPRFGPSTQRRAVHFSPSHLMTGTVTDGIHQNSFTLPQYSYEGEWIVDIVVINDRVSNTCQLYRSGDPTGLCTFDMPLVRFINRKLEALNFMPLLLTQLPTNSPFATATPTLSPP